jgi:transposase
MEVMEPSKPRARRSFTPEFKAEIVELCQRGDRSIGQVARDFDLTETAVRVWVRQAERDAGSRGDGGLTSAERQELAALRRENRRLREDVEVLKRATVHSIRQRNTILVEVARGEVGSSGDVGRTETAAVGPLEGRGVDQPDRAGVGQAAGVGVHGPEVHRWLCASGPQAATGILDGGRPGGDLPRPGPG